MRRQARHIRKRGWDNVCGENRRYVIRTQLGRDSDRAQQCRSGDRSHHDRAQRRRFSDPSHTRGKIAFLKRNETDPFFSGPQGQIDRLEIENKLRTGENCAWKSATASPTFLEVGA